MNTTLAMLEITCAVQPFETARAEAGKLANDHAGTALVICESPADDLHFARYDGVLPESFERSIAGRVFCEKFEVRWLREGDRCRIWKLQETPQGNRYRRAQRKYYLWGMY